MKSRLQFFYSKVSYEFHFLLFLRLFPSLHFPLYLRNALTYRDRYILFRRGKRWVTQSGLISSLFHFPLLKCVKKGTCGRENVNTWKMEHSERFTFSLISRDAFDVQQRSIYSFSQWKKAGNIGCFSFQSVPFSIDKIRRKRNMQSILQH